MRQYSVLLLLISIHFVLCIILTDNYREQAAAPSTDLNNAQQPQDAPSTDFSAQQKQQQSHEKSLLSSNLESMWAAVRQHMGNLNLNSLPKLAAVNANTTTPIEAVVPEKKKEENEKIEKIDKQPEDKLQSQMAPLEKALIYIKPKADERWILNEEGLVTWTVSDYLESKASSIYMNCNLYLDNKMLLSVFKRVPLDIGTESWTAPAFLKPAPNYRLRLWSQPSPVGIIDEYSAPFSIVPRREDAFMFSYDKAVALSNNNKTNNGGLVPTRKIKVGHTDLSAPTISENHGMVINVPSSSSASLNSNMPTGIYALYPSSAITTSQYVNIFSGIWVVAFTILLFLTS